MTNSFRADHGARNGSTPTQIVPTRRTWTYCELCKRDYEGAVDDPCPNSDKHDAIVEFNRKRELEGFVLGTGAPMRHAAAAFSDDRLDTTGGWLDAVKRIENAGGAIFALIGPRGTGKTQAAVCAMRAVNGPHRAVKYMLAVEIGQAVRGTYTRHSTRTEREMVADIVSPRLLVIDEAHEADGSRFGQRLLTQILDKRYGAGDRTTVLIANMTRKQFVTHVGESVASRMTECGAIIDAGTWPNRRIPAAESLTLERPGA